MITYIHLLHGSPYTSGLRWSHTGTLSRRSLTLSFRSTAYPIATPGLGDDEDGGPGVAIGYAVLRKDKVKDLRDKVPDRHTRPTVLVIAEILPISIAAYLNVACGSVIGHPVAVVPVGG
jgi:hypothetical protein